MSDRRDYSARMRTLWYDFIDDHPNIRIHMEVCPSCDGRGAYINPNIDRNGLSQHDECWEDPDFEYNYKSGVYDITCEHCNGSNIIPVPTDEDYLKEWESMVKSMYEDLSYEMAESRYFGY